MNAPAFDSRRHESRPTRSRKGRTSFVVTSRGAAQIVGSWHGAPLAGADDCASYPVLAEVLTSLGRLRHGLVGVKADDVLTITQVLYGDVLPALVGTDRMSWSEVIHAGDGASDEYGIARHRSDLISELSQAAQCSARDADESFERSGSRPLKAWPTRYRLAVRHGRRIGDPTDRHEVLASGYCITGRDHLTAPSDDRERVWQGHKLIARPAPRNGITVGHKRKRQTVKRRTVEHVTASTFAGLCARFATLERGQRVTWTCQSVSGTFTRAADGRYSLDAPNVKVRSVRTLLAIERKLEHAA